MTWDRQSVAAAVTVALDAACEGSVATFTDPPASFNVPAYVVAWADTTYHVPFMGSDLATLSIIVGVAPDETWRAQTLVQTARAALEADPTVGGVIDQGALTVTGDRRWRIADVSGARVLIAELTVEIRM